MGRRPSQAQLENIANGEPSPPDDDDAKHDGGTAFAVEEAFRALGFPKHDKDGFDISSAFIKSSIEDAYPAYFDHMACAYATAGDPSSIPEALAGPDAHLWVEALNRKTSA